MASEWFPGDGRTPEGEVFLSELRARATAWGLADVPAEETGTGHDRWGWLVAWARVPDVRTGAADVQLQVGLGLTATTPPLVAAWGTVGALLDCWQELDLTPYDSSPAGMARRAYDWFGEQLHRPVEVATWTSRRGDRSLLRFADTGEPVWSPGDGRRRDRRPDRAVRLR